MKISKGLDLYRPMGIGGGMMGFLMLVLSSHANGAADEVETENTEVLPSIEFLEFLGSFETDEGEWINPGLLIESEIGFLLNTTFIEQESDTPIDDTSETPNDNSGPN